MRKPVMVEIEGALGPYPALLDTDSRYGLWFNQHAIERICRDSQAPLGQLADMPGEGEYARLVDGDEPILEFYRLADGPDGEHAEPVWATMAYSDGRFPIPGERWPWQVVMGSRGQVWECCVSTILPVCGHQAGQMALAGREG